MIADKSDRKTYLELIRALDRDNQAYAFLFSQEGVTLWIGEFECQVQTDKPPLSDLKLEEEKNAPNMIPAVLAVALLWLTVLTAFVLHWRL